MKRILTLATFFVVYQLFIISLQAQSNEPGNCLHFDGTDDYAQVGNAVIPASGDFTVEVWINADMDMTGYKEILSQAAGAGGSNFYIGMSPAKIIRVGDGWANTSTPFPLDGKWHQLAVSKSDSETKLYLDGVLVANTTSIGNPAGTEFRIARQYEPHAEYFKGKIDEVRIWNTVRTAEEIEANIDTCLTGTENGLVAYYNFNNGTAGSDNNGLTTLTDITGNTNNGTLSGMALTGATSNWVESYALVRPVIIEATNVGATYFTANWQSSKVGAAENYLLDVATDSKFSNFVAGYEALLLNSTVTSAGITGLTTLNTYYYRVRADKGSVTGEGAFSNVSKIVPGCPDAPAVTICSNLSFNENSEAVIIDAAASVMYETENSDWTNGNLTLQIIENAKSADQLCIDTSSLLTISGTTLFYNDTIIATLNVTGGVANSDTPLAATLNDSATTARVQYLLQSITYQNISDNPEASKAIRISVEDYYNSTGSDTCTIVIIPENDPPVIGVNNPVSYDKEMSDTVLINNEVLQYTDVDNANNSLVYTLTKLPVQGTLSKSGTILALDDTFTQADIDSDALVYTHTGTEFPITDSCIFSLTDGTSNFPGITLYITVKSFFASGSGTKEDPFLIATKEHLNNVRLLPDSNFVQTADIFFNDADFASGGQYYNNGKGWEPIGFFIVPFTGEYNGGNFTINNLTINQELAYSVGLFGNTNNATIRNLGLIETKIKAGDDVGALVGFADSSIIENCFSSGGSISASGESTGGLVGINDGGSISYCYATGSVNGDLYVGGLVGINDRGSISNCYAACNATSDEVIGGLVGGNYRGSISNCYAIGSVTGNGVVGGLVGYDGEGTIAYSYSTGKVAENYPLGGFTGISFSTIIAHGYWNIETSGLYNGTDNIYSEYSGTLKGLTSLQMKQEVSFSSWDFTNTWGIRADTAFPYLHGVDNPAFAIADTLAENIPENLNTMDADIIAILTANDVDPDDAQAMLTARWLGGSTLKEGYFQIPYQVGTVRDRDTLWGTVSDVFFPFIGEIEIATYEDLKKIGSGYYPLDATFRLTANIDASASASENEGKGFMPIGNYETPFCGIFYGDGYSISNLTINRPNQDEVGLFGYASNALIQNIIVQDADIVGYYYVGALVGGISFSATVDSCSVTGKTTVFGEDNIGGLCGENEGDIMNCFVTANVHGSNHIGGLVGYLNAGNISTSYATGSVDGDDYVGGFVGKRSGGSINASYTTGRVIGSSYVGGFVGYQYYGSITSSYSTGGVSGDNHVGGFAGYQNGGSIDSSYSVGSVSGNSDIGGFTGYIQYGTITGSFWNTELSGMYEGVGYNNSSTISLTGLTSGEMKQGSNFNDWDFTTTWGIRADSTFPALQAVDNAPFAFADTVKGAFSELLHNDFDYETLQGNLIVQINSAISLISGTDYTHSQESISNGDSLIVRYWVGEDRGTAGDILWGNEATSILVLNNKAPQFKSNTLTAMEDTPLTIRLDSLATDSADVLNARILVTPENGRASGSYAYFEYIPGKDFNGSDSLQLIVSDGNMSDTSWIYITVTAVNDAPVINAVSQSASVAEDNSFTLGMDDVTATDVDNASGDFSLVVAGGDNYTVDGLTVIPDADYTGILPVWLQVTDGTDLSEPVAMNLNVTPVNDAPVLNTVAKNITVIEDGTVTLSLENVTASDVDNIAADFSLVIEDGDNYTVDGITVMPGADYNGVLSVPVSVSDGIDTSNVMEMSIETTPVNDAPMAVDAAAATDENNPVEISLTAWDVDDATLNYLIHTYPSNGTVVVAGNTVTYSPGEGFSGKDTIIWLAMDDEYATSRKVAIYIMVNSVENNTPVITSTAPPKAIRGKEYAYSVKASDTDGDALSYSLTGAPVGMVITDNIITWTPADGVTTSGEITLTVSDGEGAAIQRFTISVAEANNAPALTSVTAQSITKDQSLEITLAMTDATDADGDVLILVIGTGENYTVAGNTITPVDGFTGTLSVPLSVSDGVDNSAVVNMEITVTITDAIPTLTAEEIIIYPNPATNNFSVCGFEGTAIVNLTDLNGRKLVSISVTENEIIDLSGLKCGLVIVTISTNENVYQKRLLINN